MRAGAETVPRRHRWLVWGWKGWHIGSKRVAMIFKGTYLMAPNMSKSGRDYSKVPMGNFTRTPPREKSQVPTMRVQNTFLR